MDRVELQRCEVPSNYLRFSGMDHIILIHPHFSPPHLVRPLFLSGTDLYQSDFTPEQTSINQQLFENQQQLLEAEVERLSGLVQVRGRTLDEAMGYQNTLMLRFPASNLCPSLPPAQTCSATLAIDPEERIKVINSTCSIQVSVEWV